MKALSLWQPWAAAMAEGRKKNETRYWKTNYRGDLLICSAKRKCEEESLFLVFGAALCLVELYDCVPTGSLKELTMLEASLGDYAPDRYAWLTRNLRRLKQPVPVIGRQGIWIVPAEKEEQILAQLPC